MFKKKTAMKKTYQNPEMKIVKIQVSQILAGSPGYGGTTDAIDGNASRRFGGVWDDDDDEY